MTTDEMDGIFTQQDKDRRHSVFLQCFKCTYWTKTDDRDRHNICSTCGKDDFDLTSIISERTFDPIRSAKRKMKKR